MKRNKRQLRRTGQQHLRQKPRVHNRTKTPRLYDTALTYRQETPSSWTTDTAQHAITDHCVSQKKQLSKGHIINPVPADQLSKPANRQQVKEWLGGCVREDVSVWTDTAR